MAADRIIILVYYIISVRFAMIEPGTTTSKDQLERGRGVAGGVSRANPEKVFGPQFSPKGRETTIDLETPA
jgi:hypothetical protein